MVKYAGSSTPGADPLGIGPAAEPSGNIFYAFYGPTTTPSGRTWLAGQGLVTPSPNFYDTALGLPGNSMASVGLNDDDAVIFQADNRVGSDLQAKVSGLEQGQYSVSLYFRELEFSSAGQRIYASVEVNGVSFATNFDPYQYGLDAYSQTAAAIELAADVTVDSQGELDLLITQSVGATAICGLRYRKLATMLDVVYLNFDREINNTTTGILWRQGSPYITNQPVRYAGPDFGNVGIEFQGPVDQLDPPLDPTDQTLVEDHTYPGPGQVDLFLLHPDLRAGFWEVGYYMAQDNNPPIADRRATITFQTDQSAQLFDISGVNLARSLKAMVYVPDEGGGVGALRLDMERITDLAAICALQAIRQPATPAQVNAGDTLHISPDKQWPTDRYVVRQQDQQLVSYANPITGLNTVGLSDPEDLPLMQSYRYGFDSSNGGHSLTYTVDLEGGQLYTVRVYTFEPSTSSNVVGDRVVDVYVNDALTREGVDVLALSGGKDIAHLYLLDYTPAGSGVGPITFEFRGRPSSGDYSPIVSALEFAPTTFLDYEFLLDHNGDQITDHTGDPILTNVTNITYGSGIWDFPAMGFFGNGSQVDDSQGVWDFPVMEFGGNGWEVVASTGTWTFPGMGFFGLGREAPDTLGTWTFPAMEFSGNGVETETNSGTWDMPGMKFSGLGAEVAEGTGTWHYPGMRFSGRGVEGTVIWIPVEVDRTTPWQPSN